MPPGSPKTEPDAPGPGGIGRRAVLVASAAALGAYAMRRFARPAPVRAEAELSAPPGRPAQVTLVAFDDAGARKETQVADKIVKTDEEWRKQLSPLAYEVTRREGTEPPFTGENLRVHDKGVFRCVCCDTALFGSETKFDSGTGWPSFYAPIAPENVLETSDRSHGMVRTAVSCRRCDAHLGHVFEDGPKPTGLRYCMNSAALRFAKAP